MTAFVPDPESRRDDVSDGCQTTCADKVSIEDLYNAFLNPGSSSGRRGAGRIASVMGEHGEGLAEIIFGPLIKIQEDPEKKLHSPDFISERLDFIVEVKTGVIKPKGCPIGEMDSGHPSAIQSARINPRRELQRILRDVLKHAESKRDGYGRVETMFGRMPDRTYAFCPMGFDVYSRLDTSASPEILSAYDFTHYGVDALIMYLEPATFLGTKQNIGGDCFVFYQDGTRMNQDDVKHSHPEFIHVKGPRRKLLRFQR